MSTLENWINSEIELTNSELISKNIDIQLLGKKQKLGNQAIMHEWERPIMKWGAEAITKNGGRILNVGYGMGIIDAYIRETRPAHHTIVEIHPDIVKTARSNGYTDVYEGHWADFVEECKANNIKYDGIYFDVYCFNGDKDWLLFSKEVENILNPGGIYSYFNGEAARNQRVGSYLAEHGWKVTYAILEVNMEYKEGDVDYIQKIDHPCVFWQKHS
jgi:type IV protein arginine methyltransferase